MTTYKAAYFVGSLIPIGNLPLYTQDYDASHPPEATALEAVAA
jgi:hypothetical protein